MKQLVNKYDRNIRLVGLADVMEADGCLYFDLPQGRCVWSGRQWEVAGYEPQGRPYGESLEFRTWLEGQLKARGYSALGVCDAMGMSHTWLWNILRGHRRIAAKRVPELERALQMEEGVIAEALRTKTSEKPTIREDV